MPEVGLSWHTYNQLCDIDCIVVIVGMARRPLLFHVTCVDGDTCSQGGVGLINITHHLLEGNLAGPQTLTFTL